MTPIRTARKYTLGKFRRDLLAGLTVSVVEVPQAMAYALIAGVDPQYGLYSSIIQGFLGALLSSGEHLTTGPTNTQSLLIQSSVKTAIAGAIAGGDGAKYLQLVIALTLLKGLIQLIFAAAKMGTMVRYVSRSVIVGLSAGAGVLIAVGQLPDFLGIHQSQGLARWGIFGMFEKMLPHLPEINLLAVGIGVGALAVMLGMRAVSPLLPGALAAVVLAAILVAIMDWEPTELGLIPPLPHKFPTFQVPQISWGEAQALLGGALALAILGMLESVAIAKTLAAKCGERINANQEFFAQGLTNFLSSFFQCIPGSGSFTRSALDYQAGAQTRFAAVYNSIFVAAIFWLLAGQARYIPLASLAAVLLVIAYGLIDWRYIPRIVRTSRSDAFVCIATFLATLLIPLQYAIFVGIFLNIALYLRRASRLHLAEMVYTEGGPFLERPISERPINDSSGRRQVMFLQVEGDLFFALADELQDQLTHLLKCGVRVVIFRMKRTHSIDATVLHVLEQFAIEMQSRGGHVLLCGIRPELLRVLKAYGLVDLLGQENVFESGYGVFTSAKRALERAKTLLQSSLDMAGIDIEEEEYTYEI